jgi:hypothetical protein
MTIPERVNARWMATLANDQLLAAEAELHADFYRQEVVEKNRRGARYILLHGPTSLVNAWLRWMLVNTEAKTRGLRVQYPRNRPEVKR